MDFKKISAPSFCKVNVHFLCLLVICPRWLHYSAIIHIALCPDPAASYSISPSNLHLRLLTHPIPHDFRASVCILAPNPPIFLPICCLVLGSSGLPISIFVTSWTILHPSYLFDLLSTLFSFCQSSLCLTTFSPQFSALYVISLSF